MNDLHWERSYRTHGLWDAAGRRVAIVSLGPKELWCGLYRWWLSDAKDIGVAKTLRQAKRSAERAIEVRR